MTGDRARQRAIRPAPSSATIGYGAAAKGGGHDGIGWRIGRGERDADRSIPPGGGDILPFARAFLVEVREELARADTKASILLAVVTLVLGFAASNPPMAAPAPTVTLRAEWVVAWWAGLALALLGTGLLVSAVYPRTGHASTPPGRVYFFGDAVSFADPAAFAEAVADTGRHELDRVLDQILVLSRSVARKNRLIQLAIPAAAAGTLLIVLSLGVGRLP